MLHTTGWGGLHLAILVGPVLWALAASAARGLFAARATALGDLARSALTLAAALWSVAFVLDGYIAPKLATAISAAGVAADAQAIGAFSANQYTMARLGMLSIVLVGAAIAALGGALLIKARVRSWRGVVGALGVLVGGGTLLAASRGEFDPGPFTSAYWPLTAIAIGFWFPLLGAVMLWSDEP